jgi:hypothetical protein
VTTAATKEERRLVAIGDSHIDAIKGALRKRSEGDPGLRMEAYRLRKLKDDVEIGDVTFEDALAMIRQLAPTDLVVSAIGGNQHQVFGLIQHPIPFDLFEPGDESAVLAEGVELLPYWVVCDVFEAGLRGKDGSRLARVGEVAPCRVVHVAPPPPKADEAHIRRRHETAFVAGGLVEKGITPAPVRLKLWRLQIELSRRLCEEWRIGFIPPPSEALTPDGYLDPAYYANDATHANAEYGRLVLRQLEAFVAAAPVQVESLR